jgi:HSP20 family protein
MKARENQETTKQTQQGGGPERQSAKREQNASDQRSGPGQRTGLARSQQSAILASPFSFMRRFGEEMDSLFEDFGLGRGLVSNLRGLTNWSPRVEVFEREGQLVVRADLPGLNKEDVHAEITDEAIILRGERRQERQEQREGSYLSEVSYGSFYREISLPEGANAENAKATFRNGVLEISLPTSQRQSRRRQLEIQDASQTVAQPQAKAAGFKG